MAQITREQIGAAFWNLVSKANGFNGSSRRFIMWDQINDNDQLPYITQLHTGEERIRQSDGTPALKLFWHVFVYMSAGLDPTVIPETQMNTLLDAVDSAVMAQKADIGENRQTLGGLVYYCYPRGRVFVDPGDTDGRGVAMIPFEILTSWFT